MKTGWNGTELLLFFKNRTVTLTADECEEFDSWVVTRVENATKED